MFGGRERGAAAKFVAILSDQNLGLPAAFDCHSEILGESAAESDGEQVHRQSWSKQHRLRS